MRLTEHSFEAWIEHAFSHEVRLHGNAWFFDTDRDWWDPAPATAVAYLSWLFAGPEAALSWFSDEQIAQGLTYLVGTSASGDNCWACSTEVAIEERINCIQAAFLFGAACGEPYNITAYHHFR